MLTSVTKTCPHCNGQIAISGYWAKAPKTTFGLPLGVLVYGQPAFVCPRCGQRVVITTVSFSLFVLVFWSVLIFAVIAESPLRLRPLSQQLIGVGLVVLCGSIVQAGFAPYLLQVRKAEAGEKLKLIGDS